MSGRAPAASGRSPSPRRACFCSSSAGRISSERCPGSVFEKAGQAVAHSLHPVQSSGDMAIASCMPGRSLPRQGLLLKPCRRVREQLRLADLHADRCVRADERALGAIDADRRIPDRQLVGQSAPLVVGGAGREDSAGIERRYRQLVAVAGQQRLQHVRRVRVQVERFRAVQLARARSPGARRAPRRRRRSCAAPSPRPCGRSSSRSRA